MALVSDLVSAIAEVEGVPEATVLLAARYAREAGYLSQGARGRNAPRATVTDCANLLIAVNASGCVVKDVPRAIETYRRLQLHIAHGGSHARMHSIEHYNITHEELRFLNRENATFGEMLEAVIGRFIGGELENFMLKEASRYVNVERARADFGDDEDAIRARIIDSCRRHLQLGAVRFNISFHRPSLYAELSVSRSTGRTNETLAGVNFIISDEDLDAGHGGPGGDRRDVTSIGYATLMKIAEVMRV